MKSHPIALGALAIFFLVAGANHFVNPGPYLAMMPDWVRWPELTNQLSGGAEIAGGLGLLIPVLRRAAGWGLLGLLVAVFPANLKVALHGWPGVDLPRWLLWLRLPVQPLLMAWVWYAAREPARQPA